MGDPYLIDNPCTKRVCAFRDALEEHGFEVIIFAPDTKGVVHNPEVTYCRTIPLKRKTVFYRMANSVSFAFTSLGALWKAGKIDIVITTTPPALVSMAGWAMAKMKRAKLVYDVRDIWPDVALEMKEFDEYSIYYKVFRFIRDFMLRHADLVTAVSDGKVNKLKGYAPYKRIIKIPNGFDIHFLQNRLKEDLYEKIVGQNKFVCIYTGNLGLAQGLKQLLYIAEKAKDNKLNAIFQLYGRGAEERELKEYVREHQLDNVFFGGKISNGEVYTVLRAADISFVPLVNENLKDSIPTKIYEALGVGCPVLLVAEGNSVSVLEKIGLGIAVRPNQPEQLWNAFLKLYQNSGQMEYLKEHAEKLMRHQYSIQHAAQRLAKELKGMCVD